MLGILDRANTMTAEEVHTYTTGEILDKYEYMEGWHNVIKSMLHRPCGEINPEASCCQNKYE